MSSLFSQASLVVEPAVYEDGLVYATKPFDGSGDLTFTRSNDTATRVNSAGLIEKVRTNEILQSNSFDTTWSFYQAASAPIGGQSGYDGTNDAWSLVPNTNADSHNISQAATKSGLTTFSVYAKANGYDHILLYDGDLNAGNFFNVASGSVGSAYNGGGIDANIESVGNGYYRCSFTYSVSGTGTTHIFICPTDGTFIFSGNGTDGILVQDAQLETGDIATEPITTLASAVSVGPVANLPRLDYSGGATCPRLLLEPQRSNALLFSESFDNAEWNKGGSVTITANATTSPDGYQNADQSTNTGSSAIYIFDSSQTTASTWTVSVFAKKGTNKYLGISVCSAGITTERYQPVFNLEDGTLQTENLSGTNVTNRSYKIEDYSNGWYRLSVSFSFVATADYTFVVFQHSNNTSYGPTGDALDWTTATTGYAYLWGAMAEPSASYATSYIGPTYSTAVTRVGDAASKTGISSLIGQTEGVLFVDWVPQNNPVASTQQWLMFLGSGSTYISIFTSSAGKIRANVANTTDQCIIDTSYSFVAGNRYKCALAYKANDFAFYVNGVLIGTDTSGTVPAVSTLQNNYNLTAANGTNAGLNQMLLFKTRLSNADLATLTA